MQMQPATRYNRTFRPGEIAPISGVYRVFHHGHRENHDVVVLRGEAFPSCRHCQSAVHFEVVHPVSHVTHDWDFAGPDPDLLKRNAS